MWVLIIAILTADGNAITTQEFHSEFACQTAKAYVLENMQPVRYGATKAVCKKKGGM